MEKMLIVIEGGLVQDILSSDKNIEILVVDKDFKGYDEDELITDEKIKEFTTGTIFESISFNSGIFNNHLTLNGEADEKNK